MDEPTPTPTPPRTHFSRALAPMMVLAALTVGLKSWQIAHAEVAARDSIGFIRYARQLESPPIHPQTGRPQSRLEVVRASLHPPAYPVAVVAASYPARWWTRAVDEETMVLAARLASATAAVLLVVPLYLLSRSVFGVWPAFVGVLLFQTLPVCAEVTADGLTEGLYLLFGTSALASGAAALARPARWRFGASGAMCGLAYLTRPEGLLFFLVICIGALGWVSGRARMWRRAGSGLAVAFVGLTLVGGPYVALIGGLTAKTTGQHLLQGTPVPDAPYLRPTVKPASGLALPAVVVAAWWSDEHDAGQSRLGWAVRSLAAELAKTMHIGVGLLALIGVVVGWPAWRSRPGAWLLVGCAALYAILLVALAFKAGYLSERHTVFLALAGSVFAGAAAVRIGSAISGWFGHPRWWGPTIIAAACVIAAVPVLARPMHANRAGFHAAGRWLAQNAGPADDVYDPFEWSNFYAGCVFREGTSRPEDAPVRWIVLDKQGRHHSRLPKLDAAEENKRHGRLAYVWPEGAAEPEAEVRVFRLERPAAGWQASPVTPPAE